MSDAEIADFYLKAHQKALATSPEDDLAPVTGGTRLRRKFTDFAHRLGMRKAFGYLKSALGPLTGLSVLDVGCGRGRWVKEYARRGARVTGVDISRAAIELLTRQMPEHRFLCQNLTQLALPYEAFDIVNSVTVLQHLTPDSQRIALGFIARSMKKSGYLVLLENVAHFDARFVFPHTTEEWRVIVQGFGLRSCASWGSNFDVLARFHPAAFSACPPPAGAADQRTQRTWIRSAVRNGRALLSFPVELVCHWVPIAAPTHSVMVFQK